eukprot:3802443-Prymnesium_polylepis.4
MRVTRHEHGRNRAHRRCTPPSHQRSVGRSDTEDTQRLLTLAGDMTGCKRRSSSVLRLADVSNARQCVAGTASTLRRTGRAFHRFAHAIVGSISPDWTLKAMESSWLGLIFPLLAGFAPSLTFLGLVVACTKYVEHKLVERQGNPAPVLNGLDVRKPTTPGWQSIAASSPAFGTYDPLALKWHSEAPDSAWNVPGSQTLQCDLPSSGWKCPV